MLKKMVPLVGLMLVCACAGLNIFSGAQREFDKGMAFFNTGKYGEAVPHFAKATELDPEFGKAYLYLGRSHLNLRNWGAAIPPLRTALRISPAETKKEIIDILLDAFLAGAVDAFKKGDFRSSIDYLNQGLVLSPQSEKFNSQLTSAWMGLGGKLLAEGKFDEAVSAFKEVIARSPNDFNAYLGLARAFIQQGDFLKALQAAEKAAKINPSSSQAESLFMELLKNRQF
jgi:tetratricopeptide (TPR) repeat protein